MIRKRVQNVRRQLAGYSWLSDLPAMLCWAAIVGTLGALSTIAFHEGMHALLYVYSGQGKSIVTAVRGLGWEGRLLLPVAGGLVAGCLLWVAGRVGTRSNSDYMEAVAIGDGRLSVRQGLLRSLSSLITVVSGGSIGREGAMVHLGALGASCIGRFTYFSTARLRLLVACGAAAGVAAAYGAPIAGALFVAEIVLGTMTMQSFGPLMMAAATSNIVMRASGYYHTIYVMPDIPQIPAAQVLPFVFLGVVTGLGAPLFLKFIDTVKGVFKRSGLPLPLRMALGGLLLGAVLVFMPQVAGNGYSVVVGFLHQSFTWQAIALVLVCKILATALTVGSGAVGGVFTPALFVGGAVGTLFGMGMNLFWPEAQLPMYIYTLVGMGSFLGAATSAPLMAILMIFEMTLSYQIVLPLMLAGVVAYFISRAVAEVAMYDVTIVRERDKLLRLKLRQTLIRDLVRPADTVVKTSAPLSEAVRLFIEYPVRYLYVVNDDNVFQGVIAQGDLTGLLVGEGDLASKLAGDVLRRDYVKTLNADMSLDQAQEYFVEFRGERLPVVSGDEQPKLLGVVYKSAVLERYSALKRSMDASAEAMFDFASSRRER
ncbi:ClcB-like voltage-gated chloride channel protein [Paracandidimonas lactea]|uniref:ClcB-like voltage-gated chloride channel protein n=1 Tax=Paracandidimonas lactea TaxID=2895524 RepID=UPI001F013A55|nr:ClcB-like voltage-gated chloride channel protein [Paracandidimonas lactea]